MRSGTFGVLLGLVSASSVARGQAADSWTLAQQAYTRFDYATALKHSVDAISKQPQNTEARRLAARSARELEKYTECLRFMAEIPQNQILSDDVGIVGECSSRSLVSPRVLTFLQQQMSVPDNREMAAFWLGRYAYSKEDYKAAEKHLSSIQVLPDRLEKERVRMLERIRDLQKPHPVAPLPTPLPEKAPEKAVPPPPSRQRSRLPETEPRQGLSFGFDARALAEAQSLSLSDRISVEPFEQRSYETRFTAESLSKRSVTKSHVGLSSVLDADGEWRMRTPEGFLYGIGARASLAGTAGNAADWIYTAPGSTPYPTTLLGSRSRGFELEVASNLGVGWTRTFSLDLSGGLRVNAAKTTRLRLIPFMGLEAGLKFDKVQATAGYSYERIYGSGGGVGLIGAAWALDARVERLGPFSLRAPEGFSLFRYTRTIAFGSRELIRFMLMEGDFVEMNLAPRVRLGTTMELGGWLRYLSSGARQFWSGSDLRRYYGASSADDKTTVDVSYERTAMYESNTVDASGLLTWYATPNLSLEGAVGWHKVGTQYEDFAAVDLDQRQRNNRPTPGQFRELLDAGGESGLRLHAGLSFGF